MREPQFKLKNGHVTRMKNHTISYDGNAGFLLARPATQDTPNVTFIFNGYELRHTSGQQTLGSSELQDLRCPQACGRCANM